MKKTKKKRDLFGGRRDPTSCLYRAAKRYVESNGGNIIVIGGIQVQDWGNRQGMYTIGIKMLGKPPSFPVSAAAEQNP